MDIKALGYVGFQSPNAKAWEAFGPEIDHALEVSEAAILIAHTERDADLAASRLAPKLPRGIVRYGAKDAKGTSFESLLESRPGAPTPVAPSPRDPAAIFFTSGIFDISRKPVSLAMR